MSFHWALFVWQCLLLGLIMCAHQDKQVLTDVESKETQLPPDGDDLHDLSDEDVLHDLSDVVGEISTTSTPTSQFTDNEGQTCTKIEESKCSIPDDIKGSDLVPPDSLDYGNPSSYDERAKHSGWVSEWDFINPENEVKNVADQNNEEKDSAVRVLRQEGDFEDFIKMGHVVIIFFYKYSNSETLDRFLVEYDISANHLLQYGIFLALADCSVYSVSSYCIPEKVNRFAYGFREGQEKIAFPLDTLFNNNAIVASALHLDLINSVPILQTALERREIEKRCKGRCDIIFSFQRTLGTYEHRMFLEIAHAYQDNYVFAITTYTAGTLGLSTPDSQNNEDMEQRVWVVHCADKSIHEQCVVSHYRRKMLLPELLQFLAALLLPKWHELDVSPTMEMVVTPYDGTSLPWVILIYDSSCKHRVIDLAPDLAQLLHGSVATITLDIEMVSDAALQKLGLEKNRVVTPAIALIHQEQEKTALLNDYDDPLEWVNEQLATIFENPHNKEDLEYQPVNALEELVQDDEVVMGMQRDETFTYVSPLSGPDAFFTAISANELTVIAFYLAWDPVSNTLLQHMNDIVPVLTQWGNGAALHRINCFDWPRLCDDLSIAGYPELRIFMKNGQNFTYIGPISSESIARTILLYGKSLPLELQNTEKVISLLELQPELHLACRIMDAAAVGIFPTLEDASAFMEAAQILRSTHLTGYYISKKGVEDMCSNEDGCILLSKPEDPLQPRTSLYSGLQNITLILTFLLHSANYILAPLNSERLTALSSAKGKESLLMDQYLIIFFIPSDSSLPTLPKLAEKEDIILNASEEIWKAFTYLATEFSEPGFVFSWIRGDDPLADKLTMAYRLEIGDLNVVAVNWKHNPDSEKEDTKDNTGMKNGVHVYTCPELVPNSLRSWLVSLKDGNLKPSVVLGENDWEPRLPGFDYIKFMMEDEDRDAEDQLMLEMESDLSSHHHGEDNEGLLYMHKEL